MVQIGTHQKIYNKYIMLEALYFIAAIIAMVFPIGVLIVWYLGKCNHAWELVHDLEIKKPIDGVNRNIGFSQVHQCVHCKKFKMESIKI